MIKSAFAELTIASRALTTAQSNIQVSAHNVSNASTEGYSRQYTVQHATKPFKGGRVGMWGTGSEVTSVRQVRSAFLDVQYRSKNSVLGQYKIKNEQLTITETTFSALGESGLTAQLDDYFDTLEELSKEPQSMTTRNNTITSAQSIISQISTVGTQLQEQQKSINQEILTVTNTINSIGEQIASLNNQIKIYESTGDHANDLRDQRNLLIDQLSKYVNVTVRETQKNKDYDENDPTSGPSILEMSIQINGYSLVQGSTCEKLVCEQREGSEKVNEMDADGLYELKFATTGVKFDIYSSTLTGELKGLVDTRDGNNNSITMTYDAILGKSVMSGTETPQPDPANYAGNTDPAYLKDLAKYFDVDLTRYPTEADILAAPKGPNATGPQDSTLYKGLPFYMNKLNNFIRSFALSMNEGKTFDTSSGYGKSAVKTDLAGVSGIINSYDLNGDQGELLFTYQQYGVYQYSGEITDYTNINFNNIYINPHLLEDPSKLAISDSPTDGESNAKGALELISLKTNTKIYKEGTYQDYLIAMTGELAISKNQAQNFDDNYTEVLSLTQNQRLSVMGVDTNEEMVSLTRNQQVYEAAAKLISILNSVYTTCINLGR